MTESGIYLAELRRVYRAERSDYLAWAAAYPVAEDVKVAAYQRAVLVWYEAAIRPVDPYRDPARPLIKRAAAEELTRYGTAIPALTTPGDDSVDRLEKLVLTDLQKAMLKQFDELGESCRNLLLLAYYHHLSDARLSDVLPVAGGIDELTLERRQCLLMVRERWANSGLFAHDTFPSGDRENLIDRHLRGETSEEEMWQIDNLAAQDTAFGTALERMADWRAALRRPGREDVLRTLAEEETRQAPPPEPVVEPAGSNFWTYVIGGVLLLGIVYVGLTYFGPSESERLALAYFQPYPDVLTTSTEARGDERLAELFQPYRFDDYAQAYDNLLPLAGTYPAVHFYLGVCALGMDQPQRAAEWLEQVAPGESFYPAADWYLALAYLAADRGREGKARLIRMSNEAGHPYARQANELLARFG